MASTFNLKSMLTGHIERDAATIIEISRQISEVLTGSRPLAKRVPFVITEKKDQARIETLRSKYALDRDTINLLEQHHETWLRAPWLFDEYILSPQWIAMDPWTRIIFSRSLDKEPHRQVREISIASANQPALPAYDPNDLKKDVSDILNAASHYEHWRQGLGVSGGIAMVLGSKDAETSWTNLVAKKGENYDKVLQRLKDVGLPKYAEEYANLEKVLVEHKVKILLAEGRT